MIEGVVDPALRRRGHGKALFDAAFDAARAVSNPDGPTPRAWAHGDLLGAQALAASMGLHKQRELLQLRRDVAADGSDLPPLVVDPSIEMSRLRWLSTGPVEASATAVKANPLGETVATEATTATRIAADTARSTRVLRSGFTTRPSLLARGAEVRQLALKPTERLSFVPTST